MAGFWYPYADFGEARVRLCGFADAAIGPQCGVSFSDGASLCVLRQPAGSAGFGRLWLNVLTQHVAAPLPPPRSTQGRWGKLESFFWHAMAIQGEASLLQAQTDLAMGAAVDTAVERHIWLPAHEFLLRHKLVADGVGVALDVVGVVAGTVFVVSALPEIVGAVAVVGTLGLVTGGFAAAGSAVLLVTDGIVFGAEVFGDKGRAERIESNRTVQWMRIGATIMLLPDVGVGGMRALREIGQLGNEAREASASASEAARNAAAARDRVARIAHPTRHPDPVSRRLRKVRAFERAAEAQAKAAQAAHDRIRTTMLRDLGVVPGSTLGSTGLVAGAPPDMALPTEQRERDERLRKALAPAGGMPKDVKMEMRVIGQQTVPDQ